MIERLAHALGIDTTEFFLREATPDEVIRSYRKAAIEDIRWVLDKVFEERLRDFDGNG